MNKFIRLLLFFGVICVIVATQGVASLRAETIKPDILDVQTTFKIAGVDKTKVVTAAGTNTAIVAGVSSVTGSATIASGITAVTKVIVSLDTGSLSGAKAYAVGTSSAGNITLKVYGTDTTTLSVSPAVVHWLAIGTP